MTPAGEDRRTGRREVLRRMAGAAALGAVAAAAVRLATRPPATDRRGETCTGDGVCRGCPALEGCGLPAALSIKQFLEKRS